MMAKLIRDDGRTFIIAEAGVNHNGRVDLAAQMVDAAAQAGADAVKFQTFQPETLVVRGTAKTEYQIQTTGDGDTQYDMLAKLALDEAAHRTLMQRCQANNILFLSSPFSVEAVDFLHDLGMALFKVPSGEITNVPYLRRIGQLAQEVILSTGMATMVEIQAALEILQNAGLSPENIAVLHCNTAYPTPYADVNLRVLETMAKTLDVPVGYSDHTLGIEVPLAAVALGATIIEKHFTLDKEAEGPDHRASIMPRELSRMVESIRNIEQAMGSPDKQITASEQVNIDLIRKKIVAREKIERGAVFTDRNLTTKRVQGEGLSPSRWDEIIGTAAARGFDPDEVIK